MAWIGQLLAHDRAWLPTLAVLLLTGICLVVLILTLPVGDTARGQLLSLLGLLVRAAIARSSTTFIGNAMAGFRLQAVRHIRAGDFIRVVSNPVTVVRSSGIIIFASVSLGSDVPRKRVEALLRRAAESS